jgi:hypothetical protein
MNQFMDSLNKNSIWLTEYVPAFAKELSGRFVTSLEGVPCTLELKVNHRVLYGFFTLDGEVFELRGCCSSFVEAAFGVLLEPISKTPVALLRLTPHHWGVVLEMDMPDFEDAMTLYEPHAFQFRRTSTLFV